MKHAITPYEGHNKPIVFADLNFGNLFLENDLGCYLAQPSLVPLETQLELLPSPIVGNDLCTINISSTSVGHISSISDSWVLYFDSSNKQEGSKASFVLVDP